MSRKERFIHDAGVDVIWECEDELFWIFDGEDCWFLNFYRRNDGTPMVDEFRIDDTTGFDPATFDFINGVPNYTETETEFWNRAIK